MTYITEGKDLLTLKNIKIYIQTWPSLQTL